MDTPTMRAAYIRREWYNQAQNLLPNATERLHFYEAVIDYSLNGQEPKLTGAPAIMFAMIRGELDGDRERYSAKCERNRKNATRKPIAANGCQSLPMATNTTPTPTTTPTTTTTQQQPISIEDEAREKYLIVGIFFNRGSVNPIEEARVFWNYYDSLGWRNNKGAAIVSKTSAALMWKMQGSTIAVPEQRAEWYKCFKSSPLYDCRIWSYFECARIEDKGQCIVYLSAGKGDTAALVSIIEDKCTAQLRALLSLYAANGIEYRIYNPE